MTTCKVQRTCPSLVHDTMLVGLSKRVYGNPRNFSAGASWKYQPQMDCFFFLRWDTISSPSGASGRHPGRVIPLHLLIWEEGNSCLGCARDHYYHREEYSRLDRGLCTNPFARSQPRIGLPTRPCEPAGKHSYRVNMK